MAQAGRGTGHKWCYCTWTRPSPTPSSWKGLDAKVGGGQWTVVVPRGWRAQDEMNPPPDRVVNGQVKILLWRIRQTQHHHAPARGQGPRWSTWCGLSSCLHPVDAVWALPGSARLPVKSAMMMRVPCVPVVEPCQADQWAGGLARGCAPTEMTARYSRVRIGTSGCRTERSPRRHGVLWYYY